MGPFKTSGLARAGAASEPRHRQRQLPPAVGRGAWSPRRERRVSTNADELANMAFHVQTKHLKGAADTGDSTRDEHEASTLKRMADADMLF